MANPTIELIDALNETAKRLSNGMGAGWILFVFFEIAIVNRI